MVIPHLSLVPHWTTWLEVMITITPVCSDCDHNLCVGVSVWVCLCGCTVYQLCMFYIW